MTDTGWGVRRNRRVWGRPDNFTTVGLPRCGPSIGLVSELNTARGTVATADLGVTLMHEHVFIMTTEIAQNYPDAWGEEEKRVADAIDRLTELKSRGGAPI